ncbi:hypothetical protein [Pseudomonas sp. LS.1a]|uniref:hypothetical protein n=1 Tax=Pseudomonas sp. LS.1a TaxID=2920387 RepID=UPI001F13EA54|nr:hypothetical protein [Pseudomonas sp. LS.1a]UMY59837.1 hypothetical protein MKK04_16575 [Pseudomonas sp. LS.1a]
METRRISINTDTPELKVLLDAIGRAQGNLILEQALSQYVSRLVVSTLKDRRFRASLIVDTDGDGAKAKQERIEKLRAELARLEAE